MLSSSPYKFNANATISVPKIHTIKFSDPKSITPSGDLEFQKLIKFVPITTMVEEKRSEEKEDQGRSRGKMYVVLEAVCDRIEMHHNIKEQRDGWNKLLLNSINMMTLTAVTMSAVATACGDDDGGSFLGLKLSSVVLFSGSMGMMVLMNKIQPSQLTEEQRNAERLFKQLKTEIETKIALKVLNEQDVEEAIEKVLALDNAYPLPLLGDKMIEKFPKKFKPDVWWPEKRRERGKQSNGWNDEMEMEMRDVIKVLRAKDVEEYDTLGNLALKTNKILAVLGPLLTAIAAGSSVFIGSCTAAGVLAAVAGSSATVVNSLEHGGQVGMVVEMYRNCGGFFKLLVESIESTETEKSEDAETFEIKVALKLGRSLSDLRNLARKARYSSIEGTQVQEFGSKLF